MKSKGHAAAKIRRTLKSREGLIAFAKYIGGAIVAGSGLAMMLVGMHDISQVECRDTVADWLDACLTDEELENLKASTDGYLEDLTK